MANAIKPIGEDRIPGSPKEQLFLALAEGGTVLAVGQTVDGPGHLADIVGIYRSLDDGRGHQGWLYIAGHLVEKLNGLFYNPKLNSDLIRAFPGMVKYVAFVDPHLAEKTSEKEVREIISLITAPAPLKKKAN